MGQQAIVWALAILIGANLQISNASAEEGSVTETATKSLELGDKGVPDARLEGEWKLSSVGQASVPQTGRRWPHAFLVRFEGGQVTGMNACNGFFGPYRIVGSTLQTALGETTTGCAAPAPDTWDSASMEAMMGGPFEISPDGATLTLNPRGAPTYIFKRH